MASTGNLTSEHLEIPSRSLVVTRNNGSNDSDSMSASQSSGRIPKNRKETLRQQESPPLTAVDDDNLLDDAQDDFDVEDSNWAPRHHGPASTRSSIFLSPPPEGNRPEFSISRKQLPALPPDGAI